MDFASLLITGSGYAALGLLPPIAWLLVYLREDTDHEPFYLILLTFLGGIAAAIAALIIQRAFLSQFDLVRQFIIVFAAIAVIEEYMKYLVVKFLVLRNPAFDRPVDGMIYMVTAGMGFAAMENILFLYFQAYDPHLLLFENFLLAGRLSAARFIGANLLHALSSLVVGYFLAKAWFHPKRHHLIAAGIILASILHAVFNYLIILRDKIPGGLVYLIALLGMALVIVLIDFHKLKNQEKASDQASSIGI